MIEMRTIKKLSTALMAFFVLTLFFACEKEEAFTPNEPTTTIESEFTNETSNNSAKVDQTDLSKLVAAAESVIPITWFYSNEPFVITQGIYAGKPSQADDSGITPLPSPTVNLEVFANSSYTTDNGTSPVPTQFQWEVVVANTDAALDSPAILIDNQMTFQAQLYTEYKVRMKADYSDGSYLKKEFTLTLMIPLAENVGGYYGVGEYDMVIAGGGEETTYEALTGFGPSGGGAIFMILP